MEVAQANYFAAYRSLKLTRDSDGVLLGEFHSNGGPFTFTAQDHTELVDAFYRIAQDRPNKIVILKGAGGDFIPSIDFPSIAAMIGTRMLAIIQNMLDGQCDCRGRRCDLP
jgi:enoyl-CoA hydratase/carnithine racemase